MLGLVIIDMQKWMFRYPERSNQIPSLIGHINSLADAFAELGFPIFNVQTVHKKDRSTWSRLMLKHDYACMIEGTEDVEPVQGYRPPKQAVQIIKTANSAFLGTDFQSSLQRTGTAELVLAGGFIDGCVGLTAADAAQRGFEVTLVDDAIGHSHSDRRAAILKWLVEDYELKVLSTQQMIAMARLS